jgi:ribosomal protein S18 acetylase RimI-like enzyme
MNQSQEAPEMVQAQVSLRPAVEADFDFLYSLHREALKGYIEQIWGWDEGWQQDYFRERFELAGKRIIQYGGEDIGGLAVQDEGEHLFLAYIALLPGYQRQGIGGHLIGELLNRAAGIGKAVRLKVLVSNPARALYERLGFTVTEKNDIHIFMEASPGQAPTNELTG